MSNRPGSLPVNLDGGGLRIGVVQARFNEDITNALWNACHAELLKLGVHQGNILHASVPGALEVPICLQRMAESAAFDALVALGAVVKGDTYHFELVCERSAAGIAQLALDYGIPIANAVLTAYTREQAEARMVEKGAEAARVAVEMGNLLLSLDDSLPDDATDENDE
ncbi:MAG: 6,7-dimethyl-8-ribityllumazine synthase [Burkholderiaceae bacterium]|jgi:6,7-dimethyl-8-ribityllumazine synthase